MIPIPCLQNHLRSTLPILVLALNPLFGVPAGDSPDTDRFFDRFELRLGAALPANNAGDSWDHRFVTATALFTRPIHPGSSTEWGCELALGHQYSPSDAYLAALQAVLRQSFLTKPDKRGCGIEIAFGAALSDVGTPATGQPLNFLSSATLTADWPSRLLGTDGIYLQYSHLSNGGLNQINNGLDQLHLGLRRFF